MDKEMIEPKSSSLFVVITLTFFGVAMPGVPAWVMSYILSTSTAMYSLSLVKKNKMTFGDRAKVSIFGGVMGMSAVAVISAYIDDAMPQYSLSPYDYIWGAPLVGGVVGLVVMNWSFLASMAKKYIANKAGS